MAKDTQSAQGILSVINRKMDKGHAFMGKGAIQRVLQGVWGSSSIQS
jgi:hypothetical protein